jgi:hypothetical protein
VLESVAEHYFGILPVSLWNELLHFDVSNEFGAFNVRHGLGLIFNLALVSKKMAAIVRNLDDGAVFGTMYHVLTTQARTIAFVDPLRDKPELAGATMRAKLQHVLANNCFCCMAELKTHPRAVDNDCYSVWRLRLCASHIDSQTVGKTSVLQSTMCTEAALSLLNSANLNKGARSRRYLRYQVRNFELMRFGGSPTSVDEAKAARQRAAASRRVRRFGHFDMFQQIAFMMANANLMLPHLHHLHDDDDEEISDGGMFAPYVPDYYDDDGSEHHCPDCGEFH